MKTEHPKFCMECSGKSFSCGNLFKASRIFV